MGWLQQMQVDLAEQQKSPEATPLKEAFPTSQAPITLRLRLLPLSLILGGLLVIQVGAIAALLHLYRPNQPAPHSTSTHHPIKLQQP